MMMHHFKYCVFSGILATLGAYTLCAPARANADDTNGIYHPLDWGTPSTWVEIKGGVQNKDGQTYQSMAAGDLNGDGCEDLVIGVQGSSSSLDAGPGSVKIVYGTSRSLHGLDTSDCTPPASEQTITSKENENGDWFGYSVVLANVNGDRDADGDDLDDLLISAPWWGPQLKLKAGAVFVFLGREEGIASSTDPERDADFRLEGNESDENLGHTLAPAGDLLMRDPDLIASGSDTAEDVWVSWKGGEQGAFLWAGDQSLGRPGTPLKVTRTDDPGAQWFEATGGSGYEGFAQAMRTQETPEGAYLVLGDSDAFAGTGAVYRIPVLEGEYTLSDFTVGKGSTLGEAVFGLGAAVTELSDGSLWAGAPGLPAAEGAPFGQLWQLNEQPTAFYSNDDMHTKASEGLGWSLLSAPDLNDDGLTELIVGSPGYCITGSTPGRVYLVSGASVSGQKSGSQPLPARLAWEGGAPGDCFGSELATGDFNGDGSPDLAVLAPYKDNGALVILWSIDHLFDQDDDGVIGYAQETLSSTPGSMLWLTGDSSETGDCAPNDGDVYAGATELCDGEDQDCDGLAQIGGVPEVDGDGDSWRNCANDCNDQDGTIHPESEEICNGKDDNCDGDKDEDLGQTWYPDADGDGHGTAQDSVMDCKQPTGFVAVGDDVHDDPAEGGQFQYPGAPDRCDGLDNDEDGILDEVDDDHDDYYTCAFEDGSHRADCNDGDPDIYPDAPFTLGDDPDDKNCDGDYFSSTLADDKSQTLESGCLAVSTQSAYAPLLIPLLWLQLLRWRRSKNENSRVHSHKIEKKRAQKDTLE